MSKIVSTLDLDLVNWAIKHSAAWVLCHTELCRSQQVVDNVFYPQHMTVNIIQMCLNNQFKTYEESDRNTVELYYPLGNISIFKQDTKAVMDIVQRHLKATSPYQHVSIKKYYKPKKLESQYTTRRAGTTLSVRDQPNVTYFYKCK